MAKADTSVSLVERFEAVEAELPGARNAWLSGLRRRSIESFAEAGFPTPRLETWKYTNLRALERGGFAPAPGDGAAGVDRFRDRFIDGCDRLVFVNGRFAAEASELGGLPAGCELVPLSGVADVIEGGVAELALPDGGSLVALNTAFMRDGPILDLADGVVLARPVQILHVVTADAGPFAVHPRTVVRAGANSAAEIVETFVGLGDQAYWTNAVAEISVGPDASIRYAKAQQESAAAYHTAVTRIALSRDARFTSVALALGGALSRNETRVAFDGEGADCTLAGGALLRGRQHADNTTEADHRVPHTSSRQTFRNVVDDNGHAVFQGGVIVAKDAQKTDSSQSCRSLLLSPSAQADTKPELRIFADDVKCAHGATVGDLDHDAMFYLQSRGIPAAEARQLLVRAFVAEVAGALPDGAVRDHFDAVIERWMTDGGRANAAQEAVA